MVTSFHRYVSRPSALFGLMANVATEARRAAPAPSNPNATWAVAYCTNGSVSWLVLSTTHRSGFAGSDTPSVASPVEVFNTLYVCELACTLTSTVIGLAVGFERTSRYRAK